MKPIDHKMSMRHEKYVDCGRRSRNGGVNSNVEVVVVDVDEDDGRE
jgi:hypothetical protein